RRERSTVGEVYQRASKLLAKAGFPRAAAVTPRELAIRLTERGELVAAEVSELTDLYYAAEWGGRRDPVAEARATALVDLIRTRLIDRKRGRRAA
ncbi:MAG: DUF4129 domain-containing protein, partial [Kofleriaceae bacterium]